MTSQKLRYTAATNRRTVKQQRMDNERVADAECMPTLTHMHAPPTSQRVTLRENVRKYLGVYTTKAYISRDIPCSDRHRQGPTGARTQRKGEKEKRERYPERDRDRQTERDRERETERDRERTARTYAHTHTKVRLAEKMSRHHKL